MKKEKMQKQEQKQEKAEEQTAEPQQLVVCPRCTCAQDRPESKQPQQCHFDVQTSVQTNNSSTQSQVHTNSVQLQTKEPSRSL